MDVKILRLIEGAKEAEGLTVIIDVFRAFSLECYLFSMQAKEIRPIGSVETAFALKKQLPESVLVGERQGRKCEGFDFGNSPSSIAAADVAGKTVLHTTSAGTQGIVNAVKADEIYTGSLVNAKAIAALILKKQPEKVSLVCMGNAGLTPAPEDELCAEYIQSLVNHDTAFPLEARLKALKTEGGAHFFDAKMQDVYPEADYWLCIQADRFPFVIQVEKDELGFVSKRIDIDTKS